jgi:hypothetical protein
MIGPAKMSRRRRRGDIVTPPPPAPDPGFEQEDGLGVILLESGDRLLLES